MLSSLEYHFFFCVMRHVICHEMLKTKCLRIILFLSFYMIQWNETVMFCYRKMYFCYKAIKVKSASGNSSNLIPLVYCMLSVFHCHFIVLWFETEKRCNILFHFWNKDGFSDIFDRLLTCSFNVISSFFFQNGNVIDNLLQISAIEFRGILK